MPSGARRYAPNAGWPLARVGPRANLRAAPKMPGQKRATTSGASGFPQVQYGHAAERDYGGRAVSGGGDEAGRLGDELQGDERGLWPDGKLSGDHDVGGRR